MNRRGAFRLLVKGIFARWLSSVEVMAHEYSENQVKNSCILSGSKKSIDNIPRVLNYEMLRLYDGPEEKVQLTEFQIAGLFLRNDGDHASLDNGGTIIVDILGRRWLRKFQRAVSPEWFGARGDGTPGDEVALNLAFSVAEEVVLRDRAIYRCSSGLIRNGSLTLYGNATIVFDFDVDIGFIVEGNEGQRVFLEGVRIDAGANNGRVREIAVRFSGFDEVRFKNIACFNHYNTGAGTTRFVYFWNCAEVAVDGGEFSNIRALGDGVIGNAKGAVRAIYGSGDKNLGALRVFNRVVFRSINTVNSEGDSVFEDADAVVVQNSGGYKHDVWVDGCKFSDVGKRALKSQTSAKSFTSFLNNSVESGWGIGGAEERQKNGMFSLVSAYAGYINSHNNFSTGPVLYLEESNGLRGVDVSGNVHVGKIVDKIRGGYTRPYYHANLMGNIRYSNNRCNGAAAAFVSGVSGGVFDANIFDNILLSLNASLEFSNARNVNINSNRLDARIGTGPSIRFDRYIERFVVTDNLVSGFQDGVYFDSSIKSSCSGIIKNNNFEVKRNRVSNFSFASVEID